MNNKVQKAKKHRYHRRIGRSFGGDVAMIIFLLLFGSLTAFPLIYAIGNAFKPLDEFFVFPPHFFPQSPTMQNFSDLNNLLGNSLVPFSRSLFNTVFITVVGTCGLILLASMCAYPLAKKEFPGRQFIFKVIVAALLFNGTVTAVPLYIVMSKLGLVDNYLVMILPAFGLPMGLYIMKQFMEQMVPDSLMEAAYIDGARDFRVFWSIVMPMVRPAWLTLIIFSVQALWGTGSNALIYSDEYKTLAYSLSQIAASGLAYAGVGGAIGLIMMSVPIVVFILTQSNITEAMSTSGMKE
ncbi:MAG: carbohydrate ABC transporter permease [Clostridia bacterium]|nr:carbohydrate ABC transporter permease [Clostridia bacterium]